MTLRELRLWHWRECMRLRKKAEDRRAAEATREEYGNCADFHMGCVVTLNEVVMKHRGDTAEADDYRERTGKSRQ